MRTTGSVCNSAHGSHPEPMCHPHRQQAATATTISRPEKQKWAVQQPRVRELAASRDCARNAAQQVWLLRDGASTALEVQLPLHVRRHVRRWPRPAVAGLSPDDDADATGEPTAGPGFPEPAPALHARPGGPWLAAAACLDYPATQLFRRARGRVALLPATTRATRTRPRRVLRATAPRTTRARRSTGPSLIVSRAPSLSTTTTARPRPSSTGTTSTSRGVWPVRSKASSSCFPASAPPAPGSGT